MSHTHLIVSAFVCSTLALRAAAAGAGGGGPQIWPADERPVVEEFNKRIQKYADLHRRIEGPVPTIAVSTDPGEIRRAIDKLGNAIRAERADAQQGHIFTPEISVILRRTIRESCGSDFPALLEMVHEDGEPMPRATVNGKWPGATYPFMPPKLLLAFPRLPEELEYLFVNRDLVLWDWHANLIVDVIPNAIPRETT